MFPVEKVLVVSPTITLVLPPSTEANLGKEALLYKGNTMVNLVLSFTELERLLSPDHKLRGVYIDVDTQSLILTVIYPHDKPFVQGTHLPKENVKFATILTSERFDI